MVLIFLLLLLKKVHISWVGSEFYQLGKALNKLESVHMYRNNFILRC